MSASGDGNLPGRPAGRGRGAVLLETLRKREAEKAAKAAAEAGTASAPGITVEPPKPRIPMGRAALLEAAKKSKVLTVSKGSGRGIFPIRSSASDVERITSDIETASIAESSSSRFSAHSLREEPPVVKRGKDGKTIPATANYIRLNLELDKGLYEHEVRFNPPVDSREMRYRFMKEHMKQSTKTFDGTILYLPDKLPDPVTVYKSQHPIDESEVEMKIIFKKRKRLGECVHFYNVLFKRIMSALKMSRVGRQYFDPKSPSIIPQHKLEIWPGVVTAVDEYEGGIMLCIDSSHRVLRTQTIREFFGEIIATRQQSYKEEGYKAVVGTSVLTRYNNKLYVVDDILWDRHPTDTFSTADGEISYVEYYRKSYGITIKDLNQPLLVNKAKRRVPNSDEKEESLICLIPELCYMTGLTDAMREDFRVMKDIAQYTRLDPSKRMAALRQFCVNINKCPEAQKLLNDWGLSLASSTIDLEARILEPQEIRFRGDRTCLPDNADWNREVTRQPVLSAVHIENWIVLYGSKDKQACDMLIDNAMRCGGPMGINVTAPKEFRVKDDSNSSWIAALNSIITPELQIVLLIFPTKRDDRYNVVKKICCADKPIPSQVIMSNTIRRAKNPRSVIQKVLLQMNCKLGGSLWSVKIPIKNWMICGIDTYHDKKTIGQSVAGFVASLTDSMTRWFSQVCFQSKGVELMDGLKMCFMMAFKNYHNVNGTFPARIIIYRDGVGDGQLEFCREHEVAQVQKCLAELGVDQASMPKITFIVVQKRINTRIVLSQRDGSSQNPPPGTIVDYDITRRDWFDFFLISQHVRQGTVSPTHYVVVHDENNIPVDRLQMLSYKLCHLYYNWPGTIRVPAPCQYAHKVAQLVGQSIHKAPSDQLCDRLYFL